MVKRFLLILILSIVPIAAQDIEPLYLYLSDEPLIEVDKWEVKNTNDSINYVSYGVDIWRINNKEGKGERNYHRRIIIPKQLNYNQSISIYVPAIIYSYKIFWDDTIIGSSGTFDVEKKSGRSSELFVIPKSLSTPGIHNLKFEVFNNKLISGGIVEPVYIGDYSSIEHKLFEKLGLGLFLIGIFITTALFHLFFIAGDKNKYVPNILFSLYSISCAGHIIVNSLINYGSISLKYYYQVAIFGDIFWAGMVIFLPLFLLSYLATDSRRFTGTIITVTAIIVTLLPRLALYNIIPISHFKQLNNLSLFYAYLSMVISIAITIVATIKKRSGSKTILTGLVILFIAIGITTFYNVESSWAIGFAVLNIFITVTMSRRYNEDRRKFYSAEIKASRLELELLKKHIQPHFILNSLNSIVAWIEEEPMVASKLVYALSKELRLMMSFTSEPAINISQEIKICQLHLEVMSMRQDKEFSLKVNGKKENIKIPPFILHTIIENGISHGFKKKLKGEFTVDIENGYRKTKIIVKNNGDNQASKKSNGGTGLLYVRSRLEEMYGSNYSLDSFPIEDGWITIIKIPKAKK